MLSSPSIPQSPSFLPHPVRLPSSLERYSVVVVYPASVSSIFDRIATMNYSFRNPEDKFTGDHLPSHDRRESTADALANTPKSRWERSWPVIACGAGLFSDGYLNGYAYSLFLLRRDLLTSVPIA